MWAFQREFVIGEEFHFLFHRADVDVFCHNQEMLLVVTFMFFKTLGFSNVNIYATYIFNIYIMFLHLKLLLINGATLLEFVVTAVQIKSRPPTIHAIAECLVWPCSPVYYSVALRQTKTCNNTTTSDNTPGYLSLCCASLTVLLL